MCAKEHKVDILTLYQSTRIPRWK